jgi:uncharacterized protein YdaU (DUF1376 family)
MHYYQFNIGDYASHTRNLSLFEDLAYRRLLDEYYLHEQPLLCDVRLIARKIGMSEHEESVAFVLQSFFEESEDGWINKRAEKEILQYRGKKETASRAGKASAERRAHTKATNDEQAFNDRSTTVQPNNNHKPITNNQINTKPDRLPAVCCPEGLSADLFKEFKAVRKTPLTQRVLDKIRAEAESIGWTLEQALEKCVSRGWKSFEAEWVKEKQSSQVLSFAERDELAKRKRWEEMTGRPWPTEGETVQRLEVL